MSIDIPPDKSNTPPPRASAVDGVKTSVTPSNTEPVTLKAVVTEVVAKTVETNAQAKTIAQANASALQAENKLYQALLTVNPGGKQTLSNTGPTTEINQEISQRLIQGQQLQLRIETPAPLKVGQQLQMQLQGQALKLLQIAPPKLQAQLQHFIRHEVNQQNSYAFLLAKLISIANTIKNQSQPATPASAPIAKSDSQQPPIASNQQPLTNIENSAKKLDIIKQSTAKGPTPTIQQQTSKPEIVNPIQTKPIDSPTKFSPELARPLTLSIDKFLKSLPTKEGVITAEGLKAAIKNSGLFFENNLASAKVKPLPVAADSPSIRNASNKPAEMIQQIKQQIKSLRNTLNTSEAQASRSAGSAEKSAEHSPIVAAIRKDLKFNLLDLQKQLQQLEKGLITNKGDIVDKPLADALKSQQAGEKSIDKALRDPAQIQPRTSAPSSLSSSPVYQRPTNSTNNGSIYTNTESSSDTKGKDLKSVLDSVIAPPLPGKINIQAQRVNPQTINSESLADALVSVLVKHTKEATARLNLHQLSSMTEMVRQEAGPPQTTLSFELPIINGLDLSLFQFRIQEEEYEGANQQEANEQQRKWVVHMGFDLEGLGPMYCQVTLIGVSASVTFWAEEHDTVKRSKHHLDELRGNLSNLGVTVKDMQCIKGSPPTDQSGVKQTLIDIET